MRVRVQKWGKSLAIRIPKPFALEAGLDRGAEVEFSVSTGKLIVSSARPVYSLKTLLPGIRPANVHREVDTGRSVGGEAW